MRLCVCGVCVQAVTSKEDSSLWCKGILGAQGFRLEAQPSRANTGAGQAVGVKPVKATVVRAKGGCSANALCFFCVLAALCIGVWFVFVGMATAGSNGVLGVCLSCLGFACCQLFLLLFLVIGSDCSTRTSKANHPPARLAALLWPPRSSLLTCWCWTLRRMQLAAAVQIS